MFRNNDWRGDWAMVVEPLLFGIIIGLAAGFSPGPLIALVVSETLRNGKKEGIEVAISPLISELPIILFALLILSKTAENFFFLGAISLLGALFLIHLGLSNIRADVKEFGSHTGKDNALLKGITTNLLNPNSYLFWLTIGGPKILEILQAEPSMAIFFVLGFYTMLVGSKTAIAIVVDRSKTLIKGKYYAHITRVLGIVLIVFALIFVRDALAFLGVL